MGEDWVMAFNPSNTRGVRVSNEQKVQLATAMLLAVAIIAAAWIMARSW